jgi:predicted transcriptional regulator
MGYMPQEIEVWFVIPALRRDFALSMKKHGLKQLAISKKLGLTVPAVSQYINGKRGKDIEFSLDIKKEIEKSVNNIINKNANSSYEIIRITKIIRKKGYLCEIAKKFHVIPENCNICMR